jgi:DNA helicase IV
MLEHCPVDVHFLVPSSADELLQLCDVVQHLVIDEGQEFATTWYNSLASHLREHDLGLTLFYDLNQLGGNIPAGDIKRFEHRFSEWKSAITRIPNATNIELAINYRNSREIAEYYGDVLSECLPQHITSEIPLFSAGEVIEYSTADVQHLPALITNLVLRLQREFKPSEIAVICNGETVRKNDVLNSLHLATVLATTELNDGNEVVVTDPKTFRGHERKAIVVAAPSRGLASEKWGQAINSYIALSRARDRLIIIKVAR